MARIACKVYAAAKNIEHARVNFFIALRAQVCKQLLRILPGEVCEAVDAETLQISFDAGPDTRYIL